MIKMMPEKTLVVLHRAETDRPLPHVAGTSIKIEPKPTALSPVIPKPSQTGGTMSDKEKAQARIEAAKNILPPTEA
jgi:hypothetical protein